MEFQSLSDYPQGWIFRHRELPLNQAQLDDIRPMTEASSLIFWRQHISKEATHAAHFMNDDWPNRNGVWKEKSEWQSRWESDDNTLPEELDFTDWEDNVTVYFCYDCNNVVQTTWKTFRQCWKNFLFYDEEPLLLGRRRMQVARFHSDGTFETGVR